MQAPAFPSGPSEGGEGGEEAAAVASEASPEPSTPGRTFEKASAELLLLRWAKVRRMVVVTSGRAILRQMWTMCGYR